MTMEEQVKAILSPNTSTNMPAPGRPGMRIIGWVVPDDVAGLSDGLFALEEIARRAREYVHLQIMAVEGFDGPETRGEPVICTGCWDERGHDINAHHDIEPGEPIFMRQVNIEYDEWDTYCLRHARAFAALTFDMEPDPVIAPDAP